MSRARLIGEPMAPGARPALPATTRNVGLVAYSTGCTLLVGLLLLSNWPTYAFDVRGGVIPLYYYALPGVLMIPIVFAQPQVPLRLLHEPVFWWFAVFALLALLWQVVSQDFAEEASSQFRLRMLVFILFTTVAVLVSSSRPRVVALLIAGCVMLSGAFSWFDSLRPFRFVPQGYEFATEGRGAGLFMNPNVAASFVVMGTIAALPWVPMRFRGAMLTACVMCVAPTFSRGGFLLAGIVIVSATALGMLRRSQAALILIALPVAIAGVNLAYEYLMAHSESRDMQRVVQRLAILKDSAEEDQSVELRADATARAWNLFKEDPLFGAGIGKTTSRAFVIGPHNMYAMLMAEQGLFGLGLYLSLILLLLARGWRLMEAGAGDESADIGRAMIIFGLYIAANGLFSHNVLDEAQAIFLLAFLVMAGFQARASRRIETSIPAHRERARPHRRMRW